MSISRLLDIGNTGLTAEKIALDITGENITNVNTPGYSRQTANMTTRSNLVLNGLTMGDGVQVRTIQRYYDSFIHNQVVSASSQSGNANTRNLAMQMIQPLFNDLSTGGATTTGTGGLSGSMQSFFSAWQDLSANPQGVAERQAVLSKGRALVDYFHQVSGQLTSIQQNMDSSLQGVTSGINADLKQIASLNGQIKLLQAEGTQANELQDQRDQLIQDLSQKMGINSLEQSDGTVKLILPGAPDGQNVLVDESDYANLSLQTDGGSPPKNDIWLTPVGATALKATSFIGGPGNSQGSIGATLQMRDVTIPGYMNKLNELAATLAQQVNTAHAAGFTPSGATGIDFFNSATTAAGLALNVTSTDQVAAADADPTTGGTGNNVNAQNVAALYDQAQLTSSGSMTLGDFYLSLVGTVGVDVSAGSRDVEQTTATLNQLNNLHDSESGVSLDEELTNLTKYQRAYQGAAKVINVGTDMLDTVIGLIR